jgi:hypothetical protein
MIQRDELYAIEAQILQQLEGEGFSPSTLAVVKGPKNSAAGL